LAEDQFQYNCSSGNNTYTGLTTISAGTLQLGNGGTTGSIVTNVKNNGTLAFVRSDDVTFPGVISGTGEVTQIGPGTLILAGVNTYSGGTNFNGGILAVEGNGHLGTGPLRFDGGALEQLTGANLLADADIVLGPAGGRFIADMATSSAFRGTISGPGSLLKSGPGTLTILGDNSFSGGTTISDGTLVVGVPPGSSSDTSFALGTGNVFLNRGTLRTTSLDFLFARAGRAVAKSLIINVGDRAASSGNYTQGPSGTLALGIGGTQLGQYDRVVVGGDATLSGNLVVISLNGFHPSAGNEFAVLRSNGKRSGFFVLNDSLFNNDPNIKANQRPVATELVAPNGIDLVYSGRGLTNHLLFRSPTRQLNN